MWGGTALAEDAAWDHGKLVKEKMCNLCHAKEKVGDQVGVWKKGPHARAYQALKTDKAKEVAAKLGIDDPSASGKCLKCHSTAYGFTEEKVTDDIAVEEGVTCQTCHGPAKDYLKDHRKDVAKAHAEQGLIKPTVENTCSRCHNEENPTHNPEAYTLPDGTKSGFDYAQAYEKIKHLMKR